MTEGGNHHFRRSDKIILSSIRKTLEQEFGRKLDYRDQPRIDAELAAHGIHFHEAHRESAVDYHREARKKGISLLKGRRSPDTHPGD